jgi:preprotein translocase subunit SecA
MSILNNILKTFVGDKTKKDLNNITPLVAEIKTYEKQLESLTNDELRLKTAAFKEQIAKARAPFDDNINTLLQEVKKIQDLDEKENIYQQVDDQNEAAQQASENILNQILPEAFAVVKETAKRFKENQTLEVTASENDESLQILKHMFNSKEIRPYGLTPGMLQENQLPGTWFIMMFSS